MAKLNIELNKVYEFNIKKYSFDELSSNEVIDILKDGRFSSPFIEKSIEKWFNNLEHIVGNKEYDYISPDGQKYDAKSFTKGGMKFMPSNMIGAGRVFDFSKCVDKINEHNLIYILCDIVEFPQIRIRFMHGIELLNSYKKASIPFSKRVLIFG